MAPTFRPFPITRSFIPELGLIITQAISPKVPKIPGVLSLQEFLHKPVNQVVLRTSEESLQYDSLEFLDDEVNVFAFFRLETFAPSETFEF
ncbi:hypothetical protein AVEN_189941-1 [Araneus ventricosus]|uniref:Uncharacterized protein n=1 Tax=Araneus ventricosus TaxID=182803 RepID=A0A4Y2F0Y0_ARAVE|nr:hypothetical protein AVEN_189941-1 [Araneus ventricosus]